VAGLRRLPDSVGEENGCPQQRGEKTDEWFEKKGRVGGNGGTEGGNNKSRE